MGVDVVNHIGVSGGKDSTALLLWAVHESGYDMESIKASWCDTGNEAPETVDYVQYLSETVHPIETIRPPMDFYELARHEGRFPSERARFCTRLLKIEPTKNHIQQWTNAGIDVVLHSGVRADESHARSQMVEREWDAKYDCEQYRPLLRWTLADVWACHTRYGVKRNPLYAMGMERVGCLPCIMSRKAEVEAIARQFPERIAHIRKEEIEITESKDRGRKWFASFFANNKIPTRYRSVPIVDTNGNPHVAATVDDVVKWSEDRGQKQEEMFDEHTQSCSDRYGLCE